MLEEYRHRRDRVHEWLTATPAIRCVRPRGAFYLLPDISDLLSPGGVRTSTQFAQALLDEVRVAVTPGEAFDAPGYIRISYATSLDQLREGAARILKFAEAIRPRTGTAAG
jgi:aspartate aminotransferase